MSIPMRIAIYIGFLLLLMFAGWRAFTLGAADDLAISEPEVALSWRANHPRAVFESAQAEVRAGKAGDAARDQIRDALALNPLDGRSYRLLAELAEKAGQAKQAETLFNIAGQRAPRDLPTQDWLVQQALREHRAQDAVRHLDYLLRVEPERLNPHLELLIQLAVFGPTQGALVNVLAGKPDWRGQFLRVLGMRPGISAQAYPLFRALDASAAPLNQVELAAWVDQLANDGAVDRAYLVWVDHLPAEQKKSLPPLFNGDFSLEPSGWGYDWRFDSDHGASAARALAGPDDPALQIVFRGEKVTQPPVRQRLLLAPGPYRLAGRQRLLGLRAAQGLQWRMICDRSGSARELGGGDLLAGDRSWEPFSAHFQVPGDCPGQWLELRVVARLPVEQRVDGEAWFDSLHLTRQ